MPNEEKLIIIQDTPTKYHFKTKDDQRVNIEHVNQRIVLDLFKWDEEASLQIALDIVLADQHQFSENKIEIDTPAFTLRVYPIDTRTTGEFYGDSDDMVQCHDGGVRFELVIKDILIVNSFTVPLVAKNLTCSYQSFLSQEDIDRGVIRPSNVEGSYAFYHATKRNNKYMTGKLFHLFRPIVEDALGIKAWCSLYINPENTELTITIPQQFLDEATYPITLDPDFGYQVAGGSIDTIADKPMLFTARTGSAWTMPAGGGTANYIRAYVSASEADSCDCKVFINQQDSGGVGTHGQIATKENLAVSSVAHWEEFTLAGEVLVGAIVYILNIMGDWEDLTGKGTNFYIHYDDNTAVDSYDEVQTYGAPESPWVVNADVSVLDYSIYCNYSLAGWGGKVSGVTNPAEVMGVAKANIQEVKGVASS